MLSARIAALALLVAVTACGNAPAVAPPVAAETPQEGHTKRAWRAHLTMEVRGHQRLDVDREILLEIVEIFGDRMPRAAYFLSVYPAEPVQLDDGRTLLFSADLAPGSYRGTGQTYTLAERGATVIGGVESLGAGADVQFLRFEPEPLLQRYERFGQPCTMRVDADLRTGTVICPSLLDEDDNAVSLEWRWRLPTVDDD